MTQAFSWPLQWIGQLDVITVAFVIGLWVTGGLIVVSAVLVGWRGRRHRVARSAAVALCAAASLLAAAADTVNMHYAYLPTINDAWQSVTGDRQWHSVTVLHHLGPVTHRRAIGRGLVLRLPLPADPADGFGSTTNVVYLPPQYFTDPSGRFPVVYVFHGSPGRAADWFHAGEAASIARTVAVDGHPVIVVAPQMSQSWTDDPECVDGVREKVESHFLERVLPAVDARFRTQRNRQGRIFAGMSAGGYCALNLGLRYRNVVETILDMSGDTSPTHTGGANSLFGLHQAEAAKLVAANSPPSYAATLQASPPERIWLDSGNSDSSIVRQMSRLAPTLMRRGISVVWRVRPGGHTYRVWTAAFSESLSWALHASPGHMRGAPSRPGP